MHTSNDRRIGQRAARLSDNFAKCDNACTSISPERLRSAEYGIEDGTAPRPGNKPTQSA